MNTTYHWRRLNGFAFLLCVALLLVALYLQFVKGYEPCPLCIIQRLLFLLLAIFFLIAFIHKPGKVGQFVYSFLQLIVSLAGAGTAARQVWLQYFSTDTIGSCGPGLNYMVMNLPISETIKALFYGSGDCSQIEWSLFGFSIPVWTLLTFLLFTLLCLYHMRLSLRSK